MKRKIVSLGLATLLCLSGAVGAAYGKGAADFTDLAELDAATKAKFDALIAGGVFNGVSDNSFGLNQKMNRAQFAKVGALIFDLEVDDELQVSSFNDVLADDPANGYALPYIEAMKAAGITDGYGDGVFDPAGEVTKEQLATFLVRGLGKDAEAKKADGVDDPTVSDWAKGYVEVALEMKILNNEESGNFEGKTEATREMLALSAYEAQVAFEAAAEPEEPAKPEEPADSTEPAAPSEPSTPADTAPPPPPSEDTTQSTDPNAPNQPNDSTQSTDPNAPN